MRHIKRALLSVRYQLKKTLLILLLITTVVTLIITGISIKESVRQASQNAKDKIKAEVTLQLDTDKMIQSQSTGNTVSQERMPDLNSDLLSNIRKMKHVKKAEVQTKTYVNTNLRTVMTKQQQQIFGDLKERGGVENIGIPEGYKKPTNYLYGLDKVQDIEEFNYGKNFLVEGVLPADAKEKAPILVSKKLAEKNGLKIGQSLKINGGYSASKETTFTICGLYDTKPEKDTNEQMMPTSPMENADNKLYTTNELTEKTTLLDDPKEPLHYDYIKITVDSVDNIEALKQEIKDSRDVDWDLVEFVSDYNQYDQIVSGINNVANISTIILWIAGIAGVIILSLVMILSFRDRKFEIGVLLSMGESKLGVSMQVFAEVLIVFVLSLGLAIGISNVATDKVSTMLVDKEVQLEKEKQEQAEIAAAQLNKGNGQMTFHGGPKKVEENKLETVDKLSIHVNDPNVLGNSTFISLFIILISTAVPLVLLFRKDPKTIMLAKE